MRAGGCVQEEICHVSQRLGQWILHRFQYKPTRCRLHPVNDLTCTARHASQLSKAALAPARQSRVAIANGASAVKAAAVELSRGSAECTGAC